MCQCQPVRYMTVVGRRSSCHQNMSDVCRENVCSFGEAEWESVEGRPVGRLVPVQHHCHTANGRELWLCDGDTQTYKWTSEPTTALQPLGGESNVCHSQ